MKTKGFTLIELLVVVAIISLLTSVILASIKDAREKAQVRSFRAEMNQLVTALELYKTTYGSYPYESSSAPSGSIYNYNKLNNNGESITSGPALGTLLAQFLPEAPSIPNIISNTSPAYSVRTNVGSGTKYRCYGDTGTPPFVILVYPTNNPVLASGFTDWPYSEYTNSPPTWTFTNTSRCYSPE